MFNLFSSFTEKKQPVDRKLYCWKLALNTTIWDCFKVYKIDTDLGKEVIQIGPLVSDLVHFYNYLFYLKTTMEWSLLFSLPSSLFSSKSKGKEESEEGSSAQLGSCTGFHVRIGSDQITTVQKATFHNNQCQNSQQGNMVEHWNLISKNSNWRKGWADKHQLKSYKNGNVNTGYNVHEQNLK